LEVQIMRIFTRGLFVALFALLANTALAEYYPLLPSAMGGAGTNNGAGPPNAYTSGTQYVNTIDHSIWTLANGIWTQTGYTSAPGAVSPFGYTYSAVTNPSSTALAPNAVTSATLEEWFSPTSGLYSDTGCSVPTTSGAIACWGDASGNGNNATQSTSGNRPTYAASSINGLSTVAFAGASNQYLSNPYFTEPGTVFVVYKINNNVGTSYGAQTLISGDLANSTQIPYGIQQLAYASGGQLSYFRNFTNSTYLYGETSPAIGAYGVAAMRTDAQTFTMYNFGQQSGPIHFTIAGTTKSTAVEAFIGAISYQASVGGFLNGNIAEIIVYNGYLSDSDFEGIEGYLQNKYALAPGSGKYLWATFSDGSGNESLMMAQSNDGITWVPRPVNFDNGVGVSPKCERDPSIHRWHGQLLLAFTAACTATPTGTSFGVAISNDGGYNFSPVPIKVDMSSVVSGGNAAVWAPEWFEDSDSSLHIIVAASSSEPTGFQLYEVHPTAPDLSTWSSPVEITGTSLSSDMIDPFMVKVGGTYYLWYKDNTTTFQGYLSSTSLTSGYVVVESGNWASWGGDQEGAVLLNLGGDHWRIYLDDSGGVHYRYADSFNAWATWTTLTAVTSPVSLSHGTIIPTP
jgi:hypothetical protein